MDQELTDVESLTLCSHCKQKFNSSDHSPKILVCKHYFCQKCIETTMLHEKEISCVHCWKRQTLMADGVKALPTHTPILSLAHHLTTLGFNDIDNQKNTTACAVHGLSWTLWCYTCQKPLCRMCYLMIEHSVHQVQTYHDARDYFQNEVHSDLSVISNLLQEIQRLCGQQRELQLRVLEACVALKTCLETDLASSGSTVPDIREAKVMVQRARFEIATLKSAKEMHSVYLNVIAEKQKLEARYHELALLGKIEEVLLRSGAVIDFNALAAIQSERLQRSPPSPNAAALAQPILLLANYCTYQMYSRMEPKRTMSPVIPIRSTIASVHPRYFFNVELNQAAIGRFIIETRPDLAPRMSHNFGALCVNESGPSYKQCSIFQCWEGESIITGDYESNNGRGGKAIYEEGYFMPDETKMAAIRGAVGMRRTQKRHDNLGLVGSQFRVILQDTRAFSAIFGHVVEGIEVVEKIASCGDLTGKPTKSIIISHCGQL